MSFKTRKLELTLFILTAADLKNLSGKLTSLHVTELDLFFCLGVTGNLSALFTHSLPTLNTLELSYCELNSDDVKSLAKAEAQGKLPQLEYLNIADNLGFEIRDLFTHSAHWNQLTTLSTCDENVLNVPPEFLTSLEKLRLFGRQGKQSKLRSITRQWRRLTFIFVIWNDAVCCIADAIEQGMFPALTFSALKILLFFAL